MTASIPTLPRELAARYCRLLLERDAAITAVRKLDRELGALASALHVFDPSWQPPTRTRKHQAPSRLPVGVLARDCVAALKEGGELWTPEVAAEVARRRRVKFVDRQDGLDFASAVAMALRRYERQGFVEITERNNRSKALRWRICGDAPGTTEI